MFITPFTLEDLQDIYEVWPYAEDELPDMAPMFRWYMSTPWCTPIRAVHGEALTIGVGASIMHNGTGWLAHIGVESYYGHRRKGVATAMARWLTEDLEAKGCTTVSVMANAESEGVYRKLGFEVHTEYVHYEGGQPDAPTEDEVELYEPHHALGVLRLDHLASGEDRRALISEHTYASRIYVRKGRVLGYMLLLLGDSHVVAQDPHSGLELLRWQLPITNKVCLPQDNIAAIEYLEDHGYTEVKRTKRMFRGRKLALRPEMIYSRIGPHLG